MERISLESQISIKGGTGYFLRTKDKFRVLAADTLLREASGVTRKIGISVSSGCRVGCRYCFTNKYAGYRQLSQRELREQVDYVLGNRPLVDSGPALKISLKQMGDPALNCTEVLDALRDLSRDFPGAMLVVSTSAPKIEADFFEGLQRLQNSGANIRLQFSCHTTSDKERAFLSPNLPMLSLAEIAAVANRWEGQLVTLNFVVFGGYSYEVAVLESLFDPAKVFIKINYIDRNYQTEIHSFHDAAVVQKNTFIEGLRRAGYQSAHRH